MSEEEITIDLSNRRLTTDDIPRIQETVTAALTTSNNSNRSNIINVNLSGNYLDSKSIGYIINTLEANNNIKFDISVNNVGFDDFMKLDNHQKILGWFYEGRITVASNMYDRKVELVLLLVLQQKTQMEISDLLEDTKTLKLPYEAYLDIESSLVEEQVTVAVASKLVNPKILHRTHYSFENWNGDVDGVVIGRYNNQDVILFCESNHNIDSSHEKALMELFNTLKYWDILKVMDSNNVEEEYYNDYQSLCVADNCNRIPYFAIGGCRFSDETAEKIRIPTPWFRVILNLVGRFEAHFQI